MMRCLALLVITDTRRQVTGAGLRLVLGFVALLALDLVVSMISFQMWLLSRPLALGMIQAILLWLLLLYARRLVVDVDAERLRSVRRTGGCVLLATLAAAIYGALDRLRLGGDYCVRCGPGGGEGPRLRATN